jgi:Ser/Thr protein kinase RdoA (MazF antagonist)
MNVALLAVAEKFASGHSIQAISPLGNGLINDTYWVATADDSFVLQRINPKVFPEPQRVIHNLSQLAKHLQQKPVDSVRLKIPELLRADDGQGFYQDDQQQLWRALELIHPAESREHIRNDAEAAQVGLALGHFHQLCSNMPFDTLLDTLPGFHIAPEYFHHYKQLLTQPLQVAQDAEFQACQAFIQAHQTKIHLLESAKQRGELQSRVIHGDPKLNNFLFKPDTDQIVSLIDLDTVKPGLVHYDIGDCLRSSCHDKQTNQFNLNRCQIILQHYVQEAGGFLSATDFDYLYAAIWLIPFELGLRFFSDYLNGNHYFRVNQPRHNLDRALAQFALCNSIQAQQSALLDCILELRRI